jgi:hypothetical protein
MANLSIATGTTALHEQQLVASTEDIVTFADDLDRFEVMSDGAADLYLTIDGTPATILGATTRRLPAGTISVREFAVPITNEAGTTKVRLISSGAPTYSIARL